MNPEPVRWGLLGAGWIADRAIAPAMHAAQGATLAAVAARDAERARGLRPASYATDDYARIIEDDALDAVYIALDNAGHEPWAIAALRAGKVVLCEKPLGLDPDAVGRMRAVEAECDGLLVEATWNLWHPRTQRAMAIVASGDLGPLALVRGAFTFDGVPADNYRRDPARGGGAMLDVGCYPLTAAAWALAGAPLTVVESTVSRIETGVDFTTESRFSSAGGIVEVLASFERPEHQSLQIEGATGSLAFPGGDAYTSHHSVSVLEIRDRGRTVVEEFAPVDPYRLMVENVSRAARGEQAWLPERAWSALVADAMAAALEHRA